MAAMRSALMGLCRRSCGNSGSSAAAFMVGRQGIGSAAARTPALPSLPSAAARNLEGWRRFSTESMKGADQSKLLLMKHKAVSILQWSRDSVNNVMKDSTLVVQQLVSLQPSAF